ncbi:MAG: hypothetical protein J2P24_17565, partial [Streptosporangiales bacterium]|nr:hypothetical protein [Streptosporangiales bacterium]
MSVATVTFITPATGAGHPARGGISHIAISDEEPAFNGATFGPVGAYELLNGTAYGSIDPEAAANAGLAYLENAARDGQGLVEYSMDFAMLRPADPSKGNGKIFYDVINRGSPTSLSNLDQGSLTDPGNGFLMRQGYEIVWSGWQPDADPNTSAYQAHFPIATRPNGRPIVKPVLDTLIPDTPESGAGNTQTVNGDILTADLTYPPVSMNGAEDHVSVTVRENYDDAPVSLSPSAVTFLPGNRIQLDMSQATSMGFDSGALYDVTYDGKNPWVGGVGFASVRDLISYLRDVPLGAVGPGAGARPSDAIAWGVSQDGRFLKDFIWQGFNTDLSGRPVFDGVIGLVSGAKKTDHNLPSDRYPFAQTSRWVRQHEDHDYPGSAFPFTYQTLHDPLTGQTDGILRRCTADRTCPKIFQIDSDFETWNGHMSLVVTDTTGHALKPPADAPAGSFIGAGRDNGVALPSNVRVFQISGQGHGAGNGRAAALPICSALSDPVDGKPVFRALVVDMDQWVTHGVQPPASEYPNLATGTLQTLDRAAATWPRIPGFPFNSRIFVNRVGDYTVQPPRYGAAYPIYVPTTNRYGNPQGGVITPDLATPLGTYMGRNFRAPGHAESELCAG